jgi:hypothetical protein
MMSIKFTCSQCGKHFKVEEKFSGKSGRCPCGNQIRIPIITQNRQEQSKSDDMTYNHVKGDTANRNRLYVYATLLCIVTGAIGVSMFTILRSKDKEGGVPITSNALSVISIDSNEIQDSANVTSDAWALFLTNDAFVSKCYCESSNGKTIARGKEAINWMYDSVKNYENVNMMCPIEASFTIKDVVSEVGIYKRTPEKNDKYFKLFGDNYYWKYFMLTTKVNSNIVAYLQIDFYALGKILPPGVKLTEAAENYLSKSERVMPKPIR